MNYRWTRCDVDPFQKPGRTTHLQTTSVEFRNTDALNNEQGLRVY